MSVVETKLNQRTSLKMLGGQHGPLCNLSGYGRTVCCNNLGAGPCGKNSEARGHSGISNVFVHVHFFLKFPGSSLTLSLIKVLRRLCHSHDRECEGGGGHSRSVPCDGPRSPQYV